MITGIGIDIAEIDRIARTMEKDRGFKELVFAEEEIAYCEPKPNKYQHYAARFAAKEAFFKALGTGWKTGTAFNEIFVVHNENGKPVLQFKGDTITALEHIPFQNIQLSLSHTSTIATAIVIIDMP